MVADLNVHWDVGPDGLAKPHAHVMLGMREVTDEGFGAKVREWNRTELLTHWREAWAEHVNERLAELDIDARIDQRSLEAQGIDQEPQHKIGPAASRMVSQGLASERLKEHHAIARAKGSKLPQRSNQSAKNIETVGRTSSYVCAPRSILCRWLVLCGGVQSKLARSEKCYPFMQPMRQPDRRQYSPT
jgi:ATP-dependent exoDNAse (exonuclease V) alpha subunit